MPLTKVRYDMLDIEVTDKIKESVTVSGAGSPLVFETSGNTNTLNKFKVAGVDKTIRSASFNQSGLLEIVLASFSPTGVAAYGQSLAWDVAASTFRITATNPADFPAEYLENIKDLTADTGTVALNLADYDKSGTALPLTESGNIDSTFTLKSGKYIRPTNASGATGGSASAVVTFLKQDGTTEYSPTYTWTTNWQDVSHSISLAALSGKTFLKSYASAGYTVSQSGLSNAANVAHTVTAANGTPSNASGSGTLNFTAPIHKGNTNIATTVTLASVFTRPEAVTGSQYTHAPSNVTSANVAASASFTYPSFTTWTSGPSTLPSYGPLVDDSTSDGFVNDEAVIPFMLGNEATSMSRRAVVNTGATRTFWFCVRANHTTKPTILTGDGTLMVAVQPGDITEGTIALRPDTAPTGWDAGDNESYKVWGISLNNGTTYVQIN
jgi:hypothetical protein